MDQLEQFIMKDNKKLRCGYTTGSCAAAAAKAAAVMLLSRHPVSHITLMTPKGIRFKICPSKRYPSIRIGYPVRYANTAAMIRTLRMGS